MRQAVGFSYGSVAGQAANCALCEERAGFIAIEIGEDWNKCVAWIQFLCGCRISSVQLDPETSICMKECRVVFSFAPIGACRGRRDEVTRSDVIGSLF
jgi:hypothetical protein